jgi:hypothetical protein
MLLPPMMKPFTLSEEPMKKILFLLASSALLTACAVPSTIRTAKIVPPRVADPSRPRQLAIIPLQGDGSGDFTQALTASLTSISIDGHPYFSTIAREKIDAVVAARNLTGKTLSNVDALDIGLATGATGVLAGTVIVDFTERQPREQRTLCLRADEDGGCLRWGDTSVSCTERTLRMTYSPRLLVTTEDGRISYGKSIKARSSSVTCSDTLPGKSGREELIRQAGELILKELRKDIAPYFVTAEVTVMNSSEGIPSGEGRDLFIQGLLAVEEDRPDRACTLWEKAGRFSSTSPSLQYDLGVCHELAGELEAALEEYLKAQALFKSPQEAVTSALERVRKELTDRTRMGGEGVR